MVHPDYQYDPRLLPEIVQPIQDGEADVVLGSRLKSGSALSGGMPWWKYISNRFLTGVENTAFGLHLSEYHTGYRAYRREVLETVNFALNADKFIFDQEIMAQVVEAGFRIAEVPVPTRYFAEASSASFLASTRYGLGILWLMLRYELHRRGWLAPAPVRQPAHALPRGDLTVRGYADRAGATRPSGSVSFSAAPCSKVSSLAGGRGATASMPTKASTWRRPSTSRRAGGCTATYSFRRCRTCPGRWRRSFASRCPRSASARAVSVIAAAACRLVC